MQEEKILIQFTIKHANIFRMSQIKIVIKSYHLNN